MSMHWCRVVMNQETWKFVESIDPQIDVLEISGDSRANFGFKSYTKVEYPEFDICINRLPNKYGLIIAEQVFEHIRYPQRALANVLAMLKPGGIFLITTPFLIKYHPSPSDFWRWTKDGMKCMLSDAGFSSVESYSWGRRDCAFANLDQWVDFDPQRHSLVDEPDCPVVVWAFAKK